jgi:hypothetical protein
MDYTLLGGPDDPNCSNQYPWLYFTSPANNAIFAAPADLVVEVFAEAGERVVNRVELMSSGTLLGTDTEYPYSFDITGLEQGTYTLEAIVYDDQGDSHSSSITIHVYHSSSFNTVPWIEDFTLPDGTTSDDGITSWTSARSSGNLYVQNNLFVVNDAGTEGSLTTGQIDISKGLVNISLDLHSAGNLENDDYVRLYKKVDGGWEEPIGEKTNNQDSPTSIQGTAQGNTLSLVIRAKVSYHSEYYYMDNLRVTYDASAGTSDMQQSCPVNLYPNPAKREVFVSAPYEFSISLVNLQGKEIMAKTHLTSECRLDVEKLNEGFYIAKVSAKNYQAVRKLIIK